MGQHRNTRGGALLAVLVMSVVMAIAATLALETSRDLLLGARALRTSAAAQAAAEFGIAETADTYHGWDSIATGEILTLDEVLISSMSGAFYQSSVQRIDGDTLNLLGTQRTFLIETTGHDIGGGLHTVTMVHQTATSLVAGLATSSAATTRGTVDVHGGALISGFDANPPEWSGVCGALGADKPGLTMNDTSSTFLDVSGGTNQGNPALAEVTLNDSLLSYFGEIHWDDLLALPHVTVLGAAPRDLVGCPDAIIVARLCGPNEIGPRYNPDGTCDVTAEMNWGSGDPADPCFHHFPIIEIVDEVDVNNCPAGGLGACQGMFVLASDTTGGVRAGAELDVELNVKLRGPIFGRGCVEFQQGADYRGSVFVDGTYDFGECNLDATLDVHDAGTEVHYSSCAIERALLANGLGIPVLAFDRVKPIGSRAYGEPLR